MDIFQPESEFRNVSNEIFHELKKHTKRPDDISSCFIRQQDLVKVWQNEDRLRKLLYNDRLRPEDVRRIQKSFIAILSILVSIHATDTMLNFRDTFLAGTITDRDLPLEREQIETFFPDHPALVGMFDTVQCGFCPVTICCTRSVQSVPRKCRLPFVEPPTRLGVGGFGEVDLVAIAPRYWKGDEGADYDVVYKVACKRFRSNKDFSKEAENLRILKNSLTRQDHILHHYTTLFHDPYHYIFFPYAENGDLNQLLLDCDEDYSLFHERFPQVPAAGDPVVFKPLLHQCWALASAVNWLHSGIQVDTKSIMCAHLDLKPDNILIRKADDSIVGKWMISDFGISAIEPHRDGSRPALSVGYRYRQLTIETDPKHRAGTYLPPEAIHRGATTAATDKVGRQSDIWAYGCIFSEVLAWAIGRSVVVNELAESRGKNARSDTFWEESSGQNLSPQPTGYKLREPVATWLDKVGNSPERVLRDWAQTIKDVLITDKHARPNAAKLVEYVKKVCSSCDQPSEAVNDNDRQPTPDYTPPPSSLSSGSSDLGQSPEQRSKPIWYGTKYGIASYLSRTAWQGKVPAAVVSQDKIEIIELGLSREEVKLIDEISLSPKWEDASIVIEGQYFAAWGYCKAEKKRTLRIGDRNSNFEPNLPASQGLVCSVAVSCGGIFALVRDKDIVLLSWPCTSASSVHCRLTIPSPLDQTFTHAIFNEGGDLLFAWARGQKQESLYVWNVQREIVSVPDFVTHYSLRYRFYLDTQVIPYKNGRGCILAGDHNKYLAVSLERPSNTELPGIDRLDETIDVVVSCLVGDDQLLGLVSNRGFRTRLCLRRYKIDHGEDRDFLILQDQELCNIKIPKEFKSANLMRAYQEEETITVVLWHGTRILILKGIKRI